jgi:hypothetical protein
MSSSAARTKKGKEQDWLATYSCRRASVGSRLRPWAGAVGWGGRTGRMLGRWTRHPTTAKTMVCAYHETSSWTCNSHYVVWCRGLKRPNPLGLKCDTITSPRRQVNTFIHQIVSDMLKRDKPIKVAINFKSWSTTRDISSEWGWSSPIYVAKQISGPTATGRVGNRRNSYPISDLLLWKTTNKKGWVLTYSAAHLHPQNREIKYNAWNMWSSGYFAEIAIFDAWLFCKIFCIFQSASSLKGAGSLLKHYFP